jgi:Uma2 family endonuclease
MSMPTLVRRWTVADLDDLPDDGNRYEVIDGELFVTPAPSLRHQEAVAVLYQILAAYLFREPVGHAFFAPTDIVFSEQRAVQPDVFVVPLVSGRRPEHFDEVKRLLLAAEVLSPSTARADRVAKRTLFRDQGVSEYWVIDLDARTFERSIPGDPRVEVMSERVAWHPEGAGEPLDLDVTGYFARVLND